MGLGDNCAGEHMLPSHLGVVLGPGYICTPCSPSSWPNIIFWLSQGLFSSTSTGMGQLTPGPSYICFTLLYLLVFLVSKTETLQHFCLQVNNMKVTWSYSSDQSANGTESSIYSIRL